MNAFMRHAAVWGVLGLCALCVAAPTATPPNPPYAFARGWANLLGGWLEIPRGVIYENTRIPVVGFAAGPVKGTFLALWRELAGGMDVICFGVTRQGLYTRDVPEFVWDATWIPTCAGAEVCEEVNPPLLPGMHRKPTPPVPPAAWRAVHLPPPPAPCTATSAPAPCAARPLQSSTDAGTSFALSADEELDTRIAAMEERVREMERKAAIFK